MADNFQLSTEQLIERRAQELADERARQEKSIEQKLSSGKVFQRFNKSQDIRDNIKENVTSALWSDNITSLGTFFTSSIQTAVQKKYYYSIYQSQSSDPNAEKQFDVSWGHKLGSGSEDGADSDATYNASSVIYKQFAQLLLDSGEDTFTFKNNVTSNNCYFISIDRARFKDRVDPGNWQLTLAQLNGTAHANNVYTGSNVSVSSSNILVSLIDDSGDTNQNVVSITDAGQVYNIVSGSITAGANSVDTQGYGLFYPDHGIMVLNGDVLNTELLFNTVSGSNVNGDNSYKLYTSVSGSAVIDTTNGPFQGRSSEDVTSTFYYVRLRNADFNFSTNTSFTTGSLGELKYESFIGNPKVYVTTVGLYNDRGELLAIAKTSKPIPKTFDNEVVIKVKLDF